MVHARTFVALLASGLAGSASAVSLPIGSIADETALGALTATLSTPFATPANGIVGSIDSRVYVDGVGAAAVATFVYEIQLDSGFSTLEEFTIEPITPLENDLRILEILAGSAGTIVAGSDEGPTSIDAFNNAFPIADSITFAFGSFPGILDPGESAIVFIQTSGSVDIGTVTSNVQNFGGADVLVLAPVDDPGSPDLSVPEPASLALLSLGGLLAARRRRA
ncbi:MAG: PEP-CTERM sorting domain-containing protein [Planctomycetota bacterium]